MLRVNREMFMTLYSILFKNNYKHILLIIILKLTISIFSLFPAYMSILIFDDILPSFNFSLLIVILLIFLIYYIFFAILQYLLTKLNAISLINFNISLQEKFVKAILHSNTLEFQKFSSGDIIYRGNQDLKKIINNFFTINVDTLVNIIYLFIIIISLYKIDFTLATIAIFLKLGRTLYNYFISDKFKYKNDIVKVAESKLLENLKQVIERFLFVRLNRLMNIETKKYINVLRDSLEKGQELTLFRSYHTGITGIISGLSQMTIITVGAYLIYKESISIGLLMSFINLNQRYSVPVEYFSSLFFTYKDLESSYIRILPFIENKTDYLENELDNHLDNHLIIKNATFEINGVVILKNINLTVNQNDKIALVGPSGVGKSTICKLIAGIYPFEGEIFIKSNNTKNNEPYIGFVLDESSLFRGTIKENLTYGWEGKPFNDEEILNALFDLQLDSLILKDEGLNTIIDKSSLSKGEKQRIELARIMLLKPRLIILDEPTSGLDNITENIIWHNFRNACNNSTIIYTTHNYNLIKKGDRVLSMNKENTFFEEVK